MVTALSIVPILWLIVALAVLKMAAWKACSVAAIISFILAVIPPFSQQPVHMAAGAVEGAALAIWPILLVITAAIFTYNLVVHTKAMDTIKTMLSSVTSDMRVLALLLAWGFGDFMEGMAGFGTAVAIPAAMMVAVGFNPLKSIVACLVANAVPTTFGSISIPTTTLASLTGIDPVQLGTFISAQLFILNTITPLFIVAIIGGGVKALKGVLTVTILSGLALSVPELIINKFIGPELSVLASSIIIMTVIVVSAKFMPTNDPDYEIKAEVRGITGGEGVIAAMPFILIFVFLLLASKLVPAIYGPLSSIKTTVIIDEAIGAKHTFVWIATPGIMIFLAAFVGGAIQKASFGEMLGVLGKTLRGLAFTYITIIAVVVTAKLMTYSGMTRNIAEALVGATGSMYPLFAPLVGALGAFITGSGTNTNVLFGPLQVAAANSLIPGDTGLQMWLAGINSGAAGIGKMFSPQSIAIAIGAVVPALNAYIENNKIEEKTALALRSTIRPNVIMSSVFKYFVIFIIIDGLISFLAQGTITSLIK